MNRREVHEFICPSYGKAFTIDEATYADILTQVLDAGFEKQLHERLEIAGRDKKQVLENAQARTQAGLQKAEYPPRTLSFRRSRPSSRRGQLPFSSPSSRR